jgi:GNAT superfamily N-acetyltransferase
MWLPPHPAAEPESWYSYFQSWLLSARQLFNNIRFRGRGGLNITRYRIWKARQQEAQEKVWTDPKGYYFCNIVAVAPGTQGMGIGRKLFEVVTDAADREERRCYLESSKGTPNVDIYRKMGFEMVTELDCVEGEDKCRVCCLLFLYPPVFEICPFRAFLTRFDSSIVWSEILRRSAKCSGTIYRMDLRRYLTTSYHETEST